MNHHGYLPEVIITLENSQQKVDKLIPLFDFYDQPTFYGVQTTIKLWIYTRVFTLVI